MTLEQLEQKYKNASSNSGNLDMGSSADKSPVSTAGSNGSRDHVNTYLALQALIERSKRNGTMTEAQSDTLQRLAEQILLVVDLEDLVYGAEEQAADNPDMIPYMRVQFKGQTYLLTELAAKLEMVWDSEYLWFDYPYWGEENESVYDEIYKKSEYAPLDALYTEAEDSGLFDDPEVADFIDSLWFGEV